MRAFAVQWISNGILVRENLERFHLAGAPHICISNYVRCLRFNFNGYIQAASSCVSAAGNSAKPDFAWGCNLNSLKRLLIYAFHLSAVAVLTDEDSICIADQYQPCAGLVLGARLGSKQRKTAYECHYYGAAKELDLDLHFGRVANVRPNVRAKRATTAGRQARSGENVPRTARPGLVACRWRSA